MKDKDWAGSGKLLDGLSETLRQQLALLTTPDEPVNEADYDRVLARTTERVGAAERRFASAIEASLDIEALRRLPYGERERSVLADASLHHPIAISRLLVAGNELRGEDPADTEHLARLALRLTEEIEDAWPSEVIEDLKSRCLGQMGNALRINSQLPAAEAALQQARKRMERGTGDVLLAAQLDAWEGCLRRDQRQFADAIALQKRSCRGLRSIRDDERLAQSLISLAYTYRDAGEHERSFEILRQVEGMLSESHPLWLYVRNNQIYGLLDQGEAQAAERLLEETRPLYRFAPESLNQVRLRWTEGRLALLKGELGEAERMLTGVRDEFLERGIAYDAAIVSLEIAEIYAQQSRHSQLRELAEHMIAVFRSQDVERETLAAMILFQRAALAEQATLELIHRVSQQLRRKSGVGSELSHVPY